MFSSLFSLVQVVPLLLIIHKPSLFFFRSADDLHNDSRRVVCPSSLA